MCLFVEKSVLVTVTHVESPGCIYVQHLKRMKDLKKIQVKINEHCNASPPLTDLHAGVYIFTMRDNFLLLNIT